MKADKIIGSTKETREREKGKNESRSRLSIRYLHIYLNLFTLLLTIFYFEENEMSMDLFFFLPLSLSSLARLALNNAQTGFVSDFYCHLNEEYGFIAIRRPKQKCKEEAKKYEGKGQNM